MNIEYILNMFWTKTWWKALKENHFISVQPVVQFFKNTILN